MRGFLARYIVAAILMAGFPVSGLSQTLSMQEYATQAELLRGTLDRDSFDYDSLTLDLSVDDISSIATAIDGRMVTQVYAGALRGARGALAAGAGNALDQALVLAGALNEAGYEARIARATLSEDAARALLRTVAPSPARPAARDVPAAIAVISDMETMVGDSTVLAPLRRLVEQGIPPARSPDAVAEIVAGARDSLPDGTALSEQMLREAQDYYWVQARRFALDDWQDLHIAFTPDSAIMPDGFVSSPLPDGLLHRLRVELMLEVREGERFSTVSLMRTQEFPVANLGRRPLVLSVIPDIALRGGSLADIADANYYFPLLGDGLAPDARAFTMFGETLSAQDVLASNGMADLFASVAGSTSAVTNILGGLGAPEGAEQTAVKEATGLIVRVTYLPPDDRKPRVFERYLVDRIGPENRAEGTWITQDSARPLAGIWSLNALTGAIGAAELLDLQIARVGEMATTENPSLVNPAESATLAMFFDAAAQAGAGAQGMGYLAEPFIMLSETGLKPDGTRVYATDIMQSGLRGFSMDSDGWVADPAVAFSAGVAQTLLESALMDGTALLGSTRARAGSWEVLSSAPGLLTITDIATLGALDIPEFAKAAARRDLERGMVLALATGGNPAWWRIDPVSGAAIGVDAFGYGGEAAEYVMLADAIITSAIGINGAIQCGADTCCQAANAGWTILGFALLGGVGEVVTRLNWMDDLLAASLGLSTGLGLGATGANPFSGLCGK